MWYNGEEIEGTMKEKTNCNIIKVFLILIIVVTLLILISEIAMNLKLIMPVSKAVSAQEIKDNEAPVIILNGNKEIKIKYDESYKEQGYSAVDNVDGSIVDKVTVSKQIINDNEYRGKH